MQQAEANDVELNFAIPEECTNMYFDVGVGDVKIRN